jgi:cardiolipin synthase
MPARPSDHGEGRIAHFPEIDRPAHQRRPIQGLTARMTAMVDLSSSRLNPFRAMPNLLTFARICLAPFLVTAVLESHFRLGFLLFVAAGVTDALDGSLARILKQRTTLGQYLDPVADKLLLSTLFLVLTYMGLIPLRITILVFGRDISIVVVAALLYAAVGRREFKPSIFGKANTVAQITAVAAVLLHQSEPGSWIITLREVALDATVVLTIASGLHYAWMVTRRANPAVESHPQGSGASHKPPQ